MLLLLLLTRSLTRARKWFAGLGEGKKLLLLLLRLFGASFANSFDGWLANGWVVSAKGRSEAEGQNLRYGVVFEVRVKCANLAFALNFFVGSHFLPNFSQHNWKGKKHGWT